MVRPHHFKLLSVLKHKCAVNLPAYLIFLLHDAAESIKKSRHIGIVVSHHCLIQLIVSYSLAQQQTSWEELVFNIDEGLALPTPKRRRTTNTVNRPRKCRRYAKASQGTTENLLGSSSQPLELSSPENEQPL